MMFILITHNHFTSITPHAFNSNKNMMSKFNANIKFKLNLKKFKNVDIRNLNNKRLRRFLIPLYNTP
jgi:hypothetical protein